ncbi:MAG: MoxR family ATPase [Halobacteriales archaeon]|nr:MoxR family ATPase [Halobacteriales archaeon]
MQDGDELCGRIVDHIAQTFVGDPALLEKLLAGALAQGHVLFEDNPGLGKTLLVKTFAASIGCASKRVQFTPDLLPADVIGTQVWDAKTGGFKLLKGPVFTNVLLADEINRSPPKTQAALLEAMEERQVTIEGQAMRLEKPFFVLATQNPIEQEGTYPLPEAQLDRFLLRLSMGYPRSLEAESEILRRRIAWQTNDPTRTVEPVVTAQEFAALQDRVERDVFIHEDLLRYIGKVVRGLREHPKVHVGPSPRGALALLRASRALAYLRGRDFVTPDDIKAFFVEALAHRTILDMGHAIEGLKPEQVVLEVAADVPVPTRFRPGDKVGEPEPQLVEAVPVAMPQVVAEPASARVSAQERWRKLLRSERE